MASAKSVLVMLVAMICARQLSNAAVYTVGDSSGWTILDKVDYKGWAATKTFQIGDVISFQYKAQFHNVLRVTHAMYKSCNASVPLESYSTGNDSIKITGKGHHFYICGVPGHCQAGQKVDINVPRNLSTTAPAPSALASPIETPAASNIPAPAPNMAAPLKFVKGRFAVLGLITIASLAFFVSGLP